MREYKLWLDDVRRRPADFDMWAQSVNMLKEMIEDIERKGDTIALISLDNDMGEYYNDGGDGIKVLDYLVERGTLYPVELHTANKTAREYMERMLRRFWL